MSNVKLTSQQKVTVQAVYTVPANASAQTTVPLNFVVPSSGNTIPYGNLTNGSNYLLVVDDEIWTFNRVYAVNLSSITIDGFVQVTIGGIPNASNSLISAFSLSLGDGRERSFSPSIDLKPNSQCLFFVNTVQANTSSSQVPITINAEFIRTPTDMLKK